ncbi:hypothetical protein P8625_04090 [Tenacibaculum tangerinum]|uniref:Bacteriocin n=1 Tax=Tenacibaculum tangerinum TaxID=3038772 RepID=A0ABY8L504_9FLAO|nr:hypothetical protein [Tenacibaculum tangerinum]WGH76354.1 hypothetical protein P8625_04090 [Tenacibaculum tangerinum]
MKKSVFNLKGVKKLEKDSLAKINGGAQEYLCWGEGNDQFVSDSDLSGSSVHCTPIAVVEKEEEKLLFPIDGLRR